jgi:hypothetical protein
MNIGIAYLRATGRGCVSRIRVSRGEKTYVGGADAIAQVDNEARWFLKRQEA